MINIKSEIRAIITDPADIKRIVKNTMTLNLKI